jgi:hypothetical protein
MVTYAQRLTDCLELTNAAKGLTAIPLADRDAILLKDPSYQQSTITGVASGTSWPAARHERPMASNRAGYPAKRTKKEKTPMLTSNATPNAPSVLATPDPPAPSLITAFAADLQAKARRAADDALPRVKEDTLYLDEKASAAQRLVDALASREPGWPPYATRPPSPRPTGRPSSNTDRGSSPGSTPLTRNRPPLMALCMASRYGSPSPSITTRN